MEEEDVCPKNVDASAVFDADDAVDCCRSRFWDGEKGDDEDDDEAGTYGNKGG